MPKRGAKLISRIRGGGVITSKSRLMRDAADDPGQSLVANRKLRIAGLPNRKAAHAKKR